MDTFSSPRLSRFSLLFPIFGSHVQRIGLIRTLAGLLPMYLCIPILIIFHFTTALFTYQQLIAPLFSLPPLSWRNYIIIDRYRIRELSWLDKFNCMFCGYANGLTTMVNREIDMLSASTIKLSWLRKIAVLLIALPHLLLLIVGEISLQIIYNILVSRPLGLHRISIRQARIVLRDQNYASNFSGLGRTVLRMYKNTWLRFYFALEQIESAWCPLVHFEKREGVVYPVHHKNFFGNHEIEKMRQVLSTVGTVSARSPK